MGYGKVAPAPLIIICAEALALNPTAKVSARSLLPSRENFVMNEVAAPRLSRSKRLLLRLCDSLSGNGGIRQNHADCRSFSKFTFRFNATAMELNNMLHDRKSETSPPEFTAPRLVRAIKSLENSRQIFLANAGTGVTDG